MCMNGLLCGDACSFVYLHVALHRSYLSCGSREGNALCALQHLPVNTYLEVSELHRNPCSDTKPQFLKESKVLSDLLQPTFEWMKSRHRCMPVCLDHLTHHRTFQRALLNG